MAKKKDSEGSASSDGDDEKPVPSLPPGRLQKGVRSIARTFDYDPDRAWRGAKFAGRLLIPNQVEATGRYLLRGENYKSAYKKGEEAREAYGYNHPIGYNVAPYAIATYSGAMFYGALYGRLAAKSGSTSSPFGGKAGKAARKASAKVVADAERAANAARHRDAFGRFVAKPEKLTATARSLAVGAGVLATASKARRGYENALAQGFGTPRAVLEGARYAALPAVIAAAPLISRGAGLLADAAAKGVISPIRRLDTLWYMSTKFAGLGAWVPTQAALRGVERAGKVLSHPAGAIGALAVYGAIQGAREDQNTLRGALRGAARMFDPTQVITGKSFLAGLIDAKLGKAEPYQTPKLRQQDAPALPDQGVIGPRVMPVKGYTNSRGVTVEPYKRSHNRLRIAA